MSLRDKASNDLLGRFEFKSLYCLFSLVIFLFCIYIVKISAIKTDFSTLCLVYYWLFNVFRKKIYPFIFFIHIAIGLSHLFIYISDQMHIRKSI